MESGIGIPVGIPIGILRKTLTGSFSGCQGPAAPFTTSPYFPVWYILAHKTKVGPNPEKSIVQLFFPLEGCIDWADSETVMVDRCLWLTGLASIMPRKPSAMFYG